MNDRISKKEEQLREVIARYIERESNKSALITVTRVSLDEKARTGTIFVSVLPEEGELSALNFLKRKRSEIRESIKKTLSLHPIPFLDVAIDEGEKARHTIDALLKSDQ